MKAVPIASKELGIEFKMDLEMELDLTLTLHPAEQGVPSFDLVCLIIEFQSIAT